MNINKSKIADREINIYYRMSNLEELNLYLLINHNKTFVDSNNLKK